jgi:hypothetical protein
MIGGQMEFTQRLADPLDVADTPLDDRLAAEARTDPNAFAPLYERHVERVYRYLRARGANEDDAAELARVISEGPSEWLVTTSFTTSRKRPSTCPRFAQRRRLPIAPRKRRPRPTHRRPAANQLTYFVSLTR